MSEADVVSRLIDFNDLILAGISVLFTIVSAYVAGLNYFVRAASLGGRISAFVFFSFVLGLLVVVMLGARQAHYGLILRLRELAEADALSAAGRTLLMNSQRYELVVLPRLSLSLDDVASFAVASGLVIVWSALFFLTFVFRWGDETPHDPTKL
jgi:hypothetical protein